MTRGRLGFLRVGVATPAVHLADPAANAAEISALLGRAADEGCSLVVFPELSLTGYGCADLFASSTLLEAAGRALESVAEATAAAHVAAVVGLPLARDGRLYNCAALVAGGRVVGVTPKWFLPTYGEFYEARWFTSGRGTDGEIELPTGARVAFGADLLFAAENLPGAVIGIEICEDLWAPSPVSGDLAAAGATLLVNPSASDELVGKAAYRRALVVGQSGRTLAAYLYAAAGPGESSADVVYSGASMIAENGTLLAATPRFEFGSQLAVADIDLQRLAHERQVSSTFAASASARRLRRVGFNLPRIDMALDELRRPLPRRPFVPIDPAQRAAVCEEIIAITATGLARRLRATGAERVTLGLSGGLDSALALLVACRAFDSLGLPRTGICAISMPGPGTSTRTRRNAAALAAALGASFEEIDITPSLEAHYRAIGQDPDRHDVAFQNAQARERTQLLMDRGNQIGAFMVGTGDLSEIALGWSTYGGDHMSGYNPLCGVPKTLVRYLVGYAAEGLVDGPAGAVLADIGATPISPELTPAQGDEPGQGSEDVLGPYELHDFFLFHLLRTGAGPRRLLALAELAFGQASADGPAYDRVTLLRTLRTFITRFFANQFKRDALPNGPKVGTVALSPRGDWRMPPDASSAAWLAELDECERYGTGGLAAAGGQNR